MVNGTVRAKFTWEAGYGWKIPQYFELDRRDVDSQIWVEVHKIEADSNRSVIIALEHSQEYQFRLRACNTYGCSRSNTPEVKFTTDSASVFSSSEEHYNAIPTLLKTGIILGGVIVSIGILLGIWGYWRARKRKTNRRYRAVRYSTASYITWSLNAIDSVLLVKVRASSETFGHLLKRTRLILGFRWCVSCNFFAFIYKRCIVDFDEKNCECENTM